MPDPHPTTTDMPVVHHGAQTRSQVAEQGRPCPPFAAPNDEVDLRVTAMTLFRGWRTIIAVMVLVGLAGLAAVYGIPSKYRASAVLHITMPGSPDDSTPIANARLRAEQKIEPIVLKQFAILLKSDENLRKAANDVGMDASDAGMELLRAAASAAPGKNLPELLVSVTLPDPVAAERLAAAWVDHGLRSLAEANHHEIAATTERLQLQRDEAFKTFHSKRQQVEEMRNQRGLEDKQASLWSLTQQLTAAQQEAQSSRSMIRLLEARIDATSQQLQSTPTTSKETQHLGLLSKVLASPTARLQDTPGLEPGEFQIEVQRPNPTYEMLEKNLAQDRVTLAAAKRVVERASLDIRDLDQQTRDLRHELDELMVDFELSQRGSEQAKKELAAADAELTNWQKAANVQFPTFAQDPASPIVAHQVGGNPVSRLILLEAAAFMFGCLLVVIRDSYRRRTLAAGLPAAELKANPSPSDGHGCELPPDERLQQPRFAA